VNPFRSARSRTLRFENLEPRALLAVTFAPGRVMGTVQSTALVEASGLVASRQYPQVLWTHNDNGDSRLFAMNAYGRHLGVYQTGVTARDWEDLAIGPGPQAGIDYLYIADTGDNSQVRSTVTVFRVPEPTVQFEQSPVTTTLSGTVPLNFRYPDGSHDAETMIVDPANGDIYIVTKRDSRSRIYRAAYPQSTTSTTTLTSAAGGHEHRGCTDRDADRHSLYDPAARRRTDLRRPRTRLLRQQRRGQPAAVLLRAAHRPGRHGAIRRHWRLWSQHDRRAIGRQHGKELGSHVGPHRRR
jgi:hypothetical protein